MRRKPLYIETKIRCDLDDPLISVGVVGLFLNSRAPSGRLLDLLEVFQGPAPSLVVSCRREAEGGARVFLSVSDGTVLDNCLADLQLAAFALGVSCPPLPVFIPQP